MKARVLPPEEWNRLEGTEAGPIWRHLSPDNARAIVVEDGDRIVGAWLALRVIHAECIWIAPEYRGAFGVAKRLLKAMREVVAAWGCDKVITGSLTEHVTDLIKRMGGTPMPCESFVLPMMRGK